MFLYLAVAAQEGPGIVIAHPGQDVELLCALGIPSNNTLTLGWIINHIFYGVAALNGGILPGYSADDLNTLMIRNIVMNDHRNDTEHQCVIRHGMTTLNASDPTLLLIAGKYQCYVCTL